MILLGVNLGKNNGGIARKGGKGEGEKRLEPLTLQGVFAGNY